jgi:hypothetical protein
VLFRILGQVVLFAASVTVCAARLHGHNLNPAAVTQELNRCLSAVRVAASRRGSSAPQAERTTSRPPVNTLRGLRI